MGRPSRRFWFKLAKLWRCTVREAQVRCDAQEYAEWMAEYSIEPFGDERADLNAASICTLVANIVKEKNKKPFTVADFLPEFGGQRRKRGQTPDQMAAVMRTMAGMFPGVKQNGTKNASR